MGFNMKLAILATLVVVSVWGVLAYAEEAEDQQSQVVGDLKLTHCLRNRADSKVVFSIHYYSTPGKTHKLNPVAYVVLNDTEYRCRWTDGFRTGSQTACRSEVEEFVFELSNRAFPVPPGLIDAQQVRFRYDVTLNGKKFAIDEMIDIVDLPE